MENNHQNTNNENYPIDTQNQYSITDESSTNIYSSVSSLKPQKSKKKKLIIISVISFLAVIAALSVVLILFILPHIVKDISFEANYYEVSKGNSVLLSYVISPEKARNAEVTFSSSDETIASVDEFGRVTTYKNGTVTIIVYTKNKKSAVCTIKVKSPNFNELFSSLKTESWCTISNDGSSMMIDTNPKDYEKKYLILYYDEYKEASDKIQAINKELGFTDAVYQKMGVTSALQGRQSDENDNYRVSWTYHPDHGLEVLYEVKN